MGNRKDIKKELDRLNSSKQLICMANRGSDLVFMRDVFLPNFILNNIKHNTEILACLSNIKIDNPQGLFAPQAGKHIESEKKSLLKLIADIEYEMHKEIHSGLLYWLKIGVIVLLILAILTVFVYYNDTISISAFILNCVASVLCGLFTHVIIIVIDIIRHKYTS